ncbi:phage head closure protein [Marinobacter sp.]|uniref:phage head closure protein n=1 Tax=Marinobacter sp. TaxID=50741 RepID=UPI0019A97227|nr:phage head closure protein [Marinobacter sp.]
MRAGELRHRILIQRLASGQDEYGQPLNAWQDVATVWAKIEDLSGREYFQAQQVPTAQVSTRITIRWRPDIEPTMRVVHGARVLDIKAVLDPDGRRREIQLMCLEVE